MLTIISNSVIYSVMFEGVVLNYLYTTNLSTNATCCFPTDLGPVVQN